ncbi:MAG: DUF4169 family protein [Proteobacteria bacterium]|nr:DUF4169 family protein [Pseudomonadota bacterium]
MAEIVNLNKRRKAKAKADKEQRSVENRAKYGRTKQEKALAKSNADKAKKHIDAHRREKDEEE